MRHSFGVFLIILSLAVTCSAFTVTSSAIDVTRSAFNVTYSGFKGTCSGFTVKGLPGRTRTPEPGGKIPYQNMGEEILQYVNEHRASLGLPALKMDESESRIAGKHSENMASGKVGFGHSGFNNRAKAIQKSLGSVTAMAENVAEGKMTAREVVDGWLNSPGHKKNIEGNYSLTGIGYAQDKKGNIYFTQLFSR